MRVIKTSSDSKGRRGSAAFLGPILLLAALCVPSNALAQDHAAEEFDPVHHVSDGYYMDFEPLGKFELPRIFIVDRDGIQVDVFGSSTAALHSGKYRAIADAHGEESGLEHAPSSPHDVHAAETDTGNPAEHTEEMVAGAVHLETEIEPVEGSLILDLSMTRHLVFALLAAAIVLFIFISLGRRYQKGVGRTTAPRGLFQNLFETLIIFVRDEIAKPTIGPKYRQFLPYLLTAFFFILTANLLGLVPFGATATSNLMVTAVLALFTFVVTQFSGSRDHWMHIFWPPGVPVPLKFILIPVEFLGLFTKPFALAIRLFANMTAGHLVILSLIGLIFSFAGIFGPAAGYGISPVSVGFALFIYLLELLVATIQAYIFTMLSALFIGMATAEHHDAHEDHTGELPEIHGPDTGRVTPHPISGSPEMNALPAAP